MMTLTIPDPTDNKGIKSTAGFSLPALSTHPPRQRQSYFIFLLPLLAVAPVVASLDARHTLLLRLVH
ncbi:hypothetical protein DL93DRAFT_2090897 [Clavulina sp. PMI_390]|nr:hypothetical protein DL93DRAFT_2090897 [Clavulina sp. PMI_390]